MKASFAYICPVCFKEPDEMSFGFDPVTHARFVQVKCSCPGGHRVEWKPDEPIPADVLPLIGQVNFS